MKKILIILLVAFLSGCTGNVDNTSEKVLGAQEISTKEATIKKLIENQRDDVVILDVRSKQERDEEYILSSIHKDVEEIKLGELPDASKSAEIYVYCRSGNRAGQAISVLEKVGFENLTNIGGLSDWKSLGGVTNLTCEEC